MRTIERDIVAAVIFSKDGKILQALQDPLGRGVYPGCWGIVGGGIEDDEDERSALDREVLEESGIDISGYPVELIHLADGEGIKKLKGTGERVFCKMKFHTYKVLIHDRNAEDISVTLDDEHTEYRWCDPSELIALKITPPSVDLFTKLGYLKTSMLKVVSSSK
ncbi:MAG: NUDIX hydrolase [Parcubacteria group bacterium GW2011_GWA2_51_10]|nr:MAG: NUDIX hydrolase [Parcubacteria group bacterium GW2011_GWA2_51_10]